MAESLIIYAGTKYGKAKKRLVEKEAKSQGYPSTAEFVWDAIRSKLTAGARDRLRGMETAENGNGKTALR